MFLHFLDSRSSPELSTSSKDSASSSSDSSSVVGSFFVFLVLILYGKGSKIVVFGVSDSLFVLAKAGATKILIFTTSAISSCIGRYRRGVFSSTSGFSFYGVAVGDESGGRLGPTSYPGTNFWISTNMVTILHSKFTKMRMIFAADSCLLVLMSLLKRHALFRALSGFPTTCRIHSRLFVYTRS